VGVHAGRRRPAALANLPQDPNTERYIFNGQVPPALAKDLVRGPAGEAMQMTWRLLGQEPVEVPGGRVRIVDSTTFHAARTIAAALVELDPYPPELVKAHLNLDDATTTAVTAYKGKPIIIQWVRDPVLTIEQLLPLVPQGARTQPLEPRCRTGCPPCPRPPPRARRPACPLRARCSTPIMTQPSPPPASPP
jgi:hypothetical protein